MRVGPFSEMRMTKNTLKQGLAVILTLCLSGWAAADSYTYDSLNRLTAVSYTAGGGQSYSYDAAGNLMSLVSTPPATGNATLAVSLVGSGGGRVTGSGIDCGATCSASLAPGATVTLSASPAAGSTFAGWSGACTGSGSCVVSMDASSNVFARFEADSVSTFTLSVTRSGAGSGTVSSSAAGINCPGACSASLASDTSASLIASAAAGSSFVGWSGDCSGVAVCIVAITADRNVSAIFSLDSGTKLSLPLSLAAGWNLLGNSLDQALPVSGLYGDATQVITVWKWDALATGWQFYAPSMDAAALQTYASGKGYKVLSVLNPGEGYWVNASLAATLPTQTGAAFSLAPSSLATGWNLLASGDDLSPSAFNLSLGATPPLGDAVPVNFTSLWAWDNPLSRWYFYAPGLEASATLQSYSAGKGYLDFTQQGKTLGKGVGFWLNRP